MKYMSWIRIRTGRLLVILTTLAIYLLLLTMDGLRFFSPDAANASTLFQSWMRFGFSAFVGLIFLAIGALIWLYARNRHVALLLFCFSFSMMIVFVSETGAALNDPILSAINNASSPLSLSIFSALLLLFPRNYISPLSLSEGKSKPGQHHYYIQLLRGYMVTVTLLSIAVAVHEALPSSSHIVNLHCVSASNYAFLCLVSY